MHRLLAAAQGLLTGRYLKGIPTDARARNAPEFFDPKFLGEETMQAVRALNDIAQRRGQTLAQMALAWSLRDPRVTSALIGASRPEQVHENVRAIEKSTFEPDELREIDRHAQERQINLWRQSSAE